MESRVHGVRLGLGCNRLAELGKSEAQALVHRALDLGITLFDTANVYGGGQSEALLGSLLSGLAHRVEIATKFGYGPSESEPNEGASPEVIQAAIASSLRRLRMDRVATYFLHGPDPRTPIESTLQALDGLVHQGVVGSLGVSNFRPWQVVHANWLARISGWRGFGAIQCGYNLLNQRATDDEIPAAKAVGAQVWVTSPLQKGNLAVLGIGIRPHLEAAVRRVADRYKATPAQVAIAWLTSKTLVDVILIGTRDPEHLTEAHEAMSLQVSSSEIEQLELAALNML